MKTMILAAGRGSRMGALTASIPKPLLEVKGKSLIEWQIERVKNSTGITEFVINLAYLGQKIIDHLGDGSKLGVKIDYSLEQNGGLETAGGIIHALPLLGDEPFLVVNADIWLDFNYQNFLENAQKAMEEKKLAYLLLTQTPEWKKQGDFGFSAETNLVKPSGDLTFCGVSLINPELFGSSYGFLPLAPFLRSAAVKNLVGGEIFNGDFQDVGTPERLNALNQ